MTGELVLAMNLKMTGQIIGSGEARVAFNTDVRSLACVSAHVND